MLFATIVLVAVTGLALFWMFIIGVSVCLFHFRQDFLNIAKSNEVLLHYRVIVALKTKFPILQALTGKFVGAWPVWRNLRPGPDRPNIWPLANGPLVRYGKFLANKLRLNTFTA